MPARDDPALSSTALHGYARSVRGRRLRGVEATLVVLVLSSAVLVVLTSRLTTSMWRDEVATAQAADRPIGSLLHLLSHQDSGLAGYYLLMHLWTMLFGYSEASLRVPSVLAALVTVAAASFLAVRIGGVGAVTACVLLAGMPVIADEGSDARPYCLAAAAVTLAAIAAYEGSRRPDRLAFPLAWCLLATCAISLMSSRFWLSCHS